MSESSSDTVYVDARTIRQRMRESGVLEQVTRARLAGNRMQEDLYAVVWWDQPAKPTAGQPPGTRSQMLRYFRRSDGQLMAIVHQYRLTNGELGASGLPDPKWLRDGDRILVLNEKLS
jgi:hypothetical protein